MVHHLVHEVAVVRHDDDAALKVLQVLLQDLQSDDVHVVGGLVQNEEVGVLHEHRAQLQATALATGEFVDIVLLLKRSEHEMLQELHGGEVLASAQVHILRHTVHGIYHLHVLVHLHGFLAEVAKLHRFAYDEAPRIWSHKSQKQFQEGALARTVVAHDSHLLIAREVVVEVLQYNQFFPTLACREGLAHVLCLEYLASDIGAVYLQAQFVLLNMALGLLLQFVESLLAVSGLVAACLRRGAHPLQFGAVEVVGTRYLGTCIVYALLAFLQIVGIVATVGVERLVVHLQDDVAHAVQEIAVVGDHEQRYALATQIALEPLYHLQVEMVGGLVQDEQVGVLQEHVGQRHALNLSAGEYAHLAAGVAYLQFAQDLLASYLQVKCLLSVVAVLAGMPEAGIHHGHPVWEMWCLAQVAHLDAAAQHHLSAVGLVHTSQNVQQGGLARTVLRYEAHALTLAYTQRNALKKGLVAYPSGQFCCL